MTLKGKTSQGGVSTLEHKRRHGAKERVRTQFIFPRAAVEHLDRLKEELGVASRTDVLKIAIGVLHWVVSHLNQGHYITAKDQEKHQVYEMVVPGVVFPPHHDGNDAPTSEHHGHEGEEEQAHVGHTTQHR